MIGIITLFPCPTVRNINHPLTMAVGLSFTSHMVDSEPNGFSFQMRACPHRPLQCTPHPPHFHRTHAGKAHRQNLKVMSLTAIISTPRTLGFAIRLNSDCPTCPTSLVLSFRLLCAPPSGWRKQDWQCDEVKRSALSIAQDSFPSVLS